MTLEIDRFWDGEALPEAVRSRIDVSCRGDSVVFEIDAAFFDDPPPDRARGSVPGLWNHEVVEVFLCGARERYLEVELGPWGHHWVLLLEGRRRPVLEGLPIELTTERSRRRWRGRAVLDRRLLPTGPLRANAYAVHANGCRRRGRCHHAWSPVPGARPDFHRLEAFRDVSLEDLDRPE